MRTAALGIVASVGFLNAAQADETLLYRAMSVPREGESDTLRFAAFQVERYDSNFFRVPDGVQPGGFSRRSAVTSTTGFGVGFEKTYGLQRFAIDAAVSHDHYSPYNNLDFTGAKLTSIYNWSVTPSITGDFIFDRAKLPTDYEFTGYRTQTNPRTTQLARFDIDWRANAALHPRLSIYTTEDNSQVPTFQVESYKARNAEASLIWAFRTNNRVEAYARGTRGNNTDDNLDPSFLINNDFSEREYGGGAHWSISGLTDGDVRIGYIERNYSTFSQRSFSGAVGRINLNYNVTGKTRLQALASRTLNSSQTTFSSYFKEDIGRANLEYAATSKITFRPVFQIRRQTYLGSPFPVASRLQSITRDSSLQIDYLALRSLDFSFALTRSSRSSNDATLQFVDRSASIFARIKF